MPNFRLFYDPRDNKPTYLVSHLFRGLSSFFSTAVSLRDRLLIIRVVCPRNGTAVLKGSNAGGLEMGTPLYVLTFVRRIPNLLHVGACV